MVATNSLLTHRLSGLLRWAIAGVVMFGLLWTWISRPGAGDSGASVSTRVGATAPPFTLDQLDGGQVSLSELKGKVVVLNFWATWCPPCRAEMAALEAAQQNLGSRGLVVLGMNQLENPQQVGAFMREQRLTFPTALDRDGGASRLYRVQALPTTYFIDRSGVIRDVVFGGPMAQALIESKVIPLLGE